MPYRDDWMPGGPASRFDARAVRRGLPYAADPRYDWPEDDDGPLPPHPDDAIAHPDDVPDDVALAPWRTDDGAALVLPGWGRGWRWRTPRRRRVLYGMRRLVGGARPGGVLRHRSSGVRYPFWRGRYGGRSWRIVTRPGRGFLREIVAVQPEIEPEADLETGMEGEAEAFPLNASPYGIAAGAASRARSIAPAERAPVGGYRLRLPHAGVHAILSRLRPDELRRITGGDLPADPAREVARGVGRIARRARRTGRFRGRRGGRPLSVFSAPGYRILVCPTGPREGEILMVKPVAEEVGIEGEAGMEGETKVTLSATVKWEGPFTFASRGSLFTRTPATSLSDTGIYLFERRAGSKGWGPVYVGKADEGLGSRLGTRRDTMRELGVPFSSYRVFLGVPTSPVKLGKLEHVVVRTVINHFHPPKAPFTKAAHKEGGGGWAPIPPLNNLSPKEPFKVDTGDLAVTHTVPTGHLAYLAAASRKAGEYFELE